MFISGEGRRSEFADLQKERNNDMKIEIRNLIVAAAALIASGCGGSVDVETELQGSEMAIADGDMETASAMASHITENSAAGLSAKQLARLSIVYMQIADSIDNDTNVATAAEYYNRAYASNADSAELYYTSLPSEKIPYAMILSNISGGGRGLYVDSLFVESDSVGMHLEP